MEMREIARLDATAQAELVARGELTTSELLDAAEERVNRLEPLLHTMATIDFARVRGTRLADGPFHGVPFLLKDTTPYPGLRWSLGSRLMRRNMAAPPTPFGARVDAAGLAVIGKSMMSEMGLLGSTETLAEGITHNPWDLSRSATGSSGGSAAAVAAGLVPIAHANDGGGSIRIPACANGVFGFKPSRGRTVSAIVGQSDFGDITSDGCVSRSVRDAARFLSLVEDEANSYRMGFVAGPDKRRLRIGTWSQTFDGREPEPEVKRAYDAAVALVAEIGHHVEEARRPVIDAETLGDGSSSWRVPLSRDSSRWWAACAGRACARTSSSHSRGRSPGAPWSEVRQDSSRRVTNSRRPHAHISRPSVATTRSSRPWSQRKRGTSATSLRWFLQTS